MFSRRAYCVPSDDHWNNICIDPTQYAPLVAYCVCRVHKMLQRSILCMQGTQYATKRSILCRGAFCGPTYVEPQNAPYTICSLEVHIVYPAFCGPTVRTKKLIFLFLNQSMCCGYSKEPSQWDGYFEHPKHMFNPMGKKIFTILRSKILFI